ncbi:MarR family winged helix-turn-helix transcriptional regulator [Mycobacterium sp. TY814]|uniref:MarR family winged helix-turn-helix transcriptional regulator n=1 Tax=unclassified Mycobacterium TaxID=2642494 RepID=UPI002741F756|nr:MarR family transcriptional regulator [Mycobacterium sp. TY814]MDP7725169.1 MarR family transcriptional regulator [Mycobacterium sp. TY814]
MATARKRDTLDSISATIARIMRLSGSRAMFKRQAAAAAVELSQPSYVLLRVLADEGPLPMGRLARLAHMDLGMAARRVQSLEGDGMVVRQSDLEDARKTLVEATAAGERAARALQDVRREHLARALAQWSAADLRQFDRLLSRFLADTTVTSID